MVKTIIKIDGMMCNMCESHINDAVRNAVKVKKVESSHSKGETEIISEAELDEAKLREAVEKDGYKVLGITSEPYEKKGLAGLFRK
ncbi:MAG: cation transporter [Ruminococcus sp.]|nr:cation transporter [Ruminococcus sp.]